MKLVYFSILFISLSIYSQDVQWEKSYGGLQGDYLFDACSTADYGFILAGSSMSDKNGNKQDHNQGNLDYWVWKMDEHGGLEWQHSFGGSGMDLLNSILTTRDGGFLLAGSSDSRTSGDKKENGYGQSDLWIIKLNADGSEQWQVTLGGEGPETLRSAVELPDGYVLVGSSGSIRSDQKESENFGGIDGWVVRLDLSGNVIWERSLGGSYKDEITSVCPVDEGGTLLVGYSNSGETGNKTTKPLGEGDIWLTRLDRDGKMLWQKSFGGSGDDTPSAAITLKDGSVLIGSVSSTQGGAMKQKANKNGTDFWVFKLDGSGTMLWEETYDIGEFDVLSSLFENMDGSVLIGGHAKSEKPGLRGSDSKGINDYVAIKIKPDGEEIWRQSVGSNGEDALKKLVSTRDGGYILAGTSNGEVSGERNSGQGRNDFWVVKLGDSENTEEQKGTGLEAYPNPTDRFSNVVLLHDFKEGTATVYDIGGKQLQHFAIGGRTVPIDLRNYPVGIYLVNIVTDDESQTVKILKKD